MVWAGTESGWKAQGNEDLFVCQTIGHLFCVKNKGSEGIFPLWLCASIRQVKDKHRDGEEYTGQCRQSGYSLIRRASTQLEGGSEALEESSLRSC